MKKISFQNVSSRLNQKEMKNVLGGSGGGSAICYVCGPQGSKPGQSYLPPDEFWDYFVRTCPTGGQVWDC